MLRGDYILIENLPRVRKKYIIRNKKRVIIGKISMLESSKTNKSCSFRLKFNEKQNNELIKDVLNVFIKYLFENLKYLKVNILVREDMNLQPFVDLDILLEGIISKKYLYDNEYMDELLFGIDRDAYDKASVEDVLRLPGKNVELKVLIPQDAEEVLNYVLKNKNYLKPFEADRGEAYYTIESQKEL